MNETQETQDIDEDNDLFCFESDSLALKGNKDYSELLKTVFILEAQRQQAIKDYNKVIELEKIYLDDPIACVEKLKQGSLGIPDTMCIKEMPKINWAKYNVSIPDLYIRQINSDTIVTTSEFNPTPKQRKSSLHQHWSSEEQRKLEELLIKYPNEVNRTNRLKKIADELGNRTAQQVASRLQKYLIKLQSTGDFQRTLKRKPRHVERKHAKKINPSGKPSTFFPQLDIPVSMNDTDDVPGPSGTSPLVHNQTTADTISGINYLIQNSCYYDEARSSTSTPSNSSQFRTEDDMKLLLLKRIRQEKVHNSTMEIRFRHFGYKCEICSEDPIIGTRWHCATCITDSIDYCTNCMLEQIYFINQHSPFHNYIIVRDENSSFSAFQDEEEAEDDGDDSDNEDGEEEDEEAEGEEDEIDSTGNETDYSRMEIPDDDLVNEELKNSDNTSTEGMEMDKNDSDFTVSDSDDPDYDSDFELTQRKRKDSDSRHRTKSKRFSEKFKQDQSTSSSKSFDATDNTPIKSETHDDIIDNSTDFKALMEINQHEDDQEDTKGFEKIIEDDVAAHQQVKNEVFRNNEVKIDMKGEDKNNLGLNNFTEAGVFSPNSNFTDVNAIHYS